ncbi:MAG: hypothetical protein AAGJ37_13735 [Pseudomonadota bacterium]
MNSLTDLHWKYRILIVEHELVDYEAMMESMDALKERRLVVFLVDGSNVKQ